MTTFTSVSISVPEQHHGFYDGRYLLVLREITDVVDEVEHSLVDVLVSLQFPVFVLLDSVARVVFAKQRVRLLQVPGQRPLDETPGDKRGHQ